MLLNLRTNKILWNLTAILALLAAGGGIVDRSIYNGLFAPEFIPGALPQDILTVLVGLLLIWLSAKTKEGDTKKQVVIIGIIGSLFYLYGIFTIERVFNSYYLLYAAVFATAFWSVLYSLINLRKNVTENVQVPPALSRFSAISGILIGILFTILWISALLPLMANRDRIEYLYSIYILDLCFVMPAFFITGVMSLQRKGLGLLLMPAVFILGFFVIFPLGLGEIAKPYYGQDINAGSMVMSFAFSFFMALIATIQLVKLNVGKTPV